MAAKKKPAPKPVCRIEIVELDDPDFRADYHSAKYIARCQACGYESAGRTSATKARAEAEGHCKGAA